MVHTTAFINKIQHIKTRWAMYVLCNTLVCLCNHCCHGKAVSITYFESVCVCVCVCVHARTYACVHVSLCVQAHSLSYTARKAHAPYCTVICGLSGSTMFFHILTNGKIFRKKLLKIKCVFWFSLQLLSETYLILRRNQQATIINVHRSSSKAPVILVWS
jgi:hypothetical protein